MKKNTILLMYEGSSSQSYSQGILPILNTDSQSFKKETIKAYFEVKAKICCIPINSINHMEASFSNRYKDNQHKFETVHISIYHKIMLYTFFSRKIYQNLCNI